jgi:hypothetical protein
MLAYAFLVQICLDVLWTPPYTPVMTGMAGSELFKTPIQRSRHDDSNVADVGLTSETA